MLTLTRDATDIVTTLADRHVQSDGGGLRTSGPTDGAFRVLDARVTADGDIQLRLARLC